MEPIELGLGIIIFALSLLLILAVLLQSGKDKKLSGTIAGSADTFYSKQKANTRDRILSKLTPIAAAAFTLVVIVASFLFGK